MKSVAGHILTLDVDRRVTTFIVDENTDVLTPVQVVPPATGAEEPVTDVVRHGDIATTPYRELDGVMRVSDIQIRAAMRLRRGRGEDRMSNPPSALLRRARAHALLVAVILSVAPWLAHAQTTSAPPAPATLAPAEMEKFLLEGRIIKKKESSKGVTDAYRVTLSDGVVTHDAQVQNVDIAKPFFEVGPKHSEVNFKDSYRYNIAAYRLSVLLGLDNVPMSVERVVDGKPAAVTWWLDNVMDDGDRRKKKISNANPLRAADYFSVMYVFDELIQNRDRNQGNIMWSPDSRMWMIDHTRAFRTGRDFLKPENLTRIERNLFEKLRALDRQALTDAVGKILTKDEFEALFARRDRLVQYFDDRVAKVGAAIVYTIR